MYIWLGALFCLILFYFGESFLSQVILPGVMLSSPIIVLCNSATAGPKPGMKKEEGEKKNHTGKKSKSVFLNWLEIVFRHIIAFLFLTFIFSSNSRPQQPGNKKYGFKFLQESCKQDSKTCKNLASRIQNLARFLQVGFKTCKNLARILQEVCILLQDSLQDSCKFLNFLITREDEKEDTFLAYFFKWFLDLFLRNPKAPLCKLDVKNHWKVGYMISR